MWKHVDISPIPTRGKHGKEFLLNLEYCKFFGHDHSKTSEVVTAIWDSCEECFFEKETGLAIDDRDIIEWWCE